MICQLLAYEAGGNIIGTLDYVVQLDANRSPGLVDFAAHEEAGGEHTDIWRVEGAAGSKVWPEWLGGRAHDFRVELEGEPGRKRIAALVHRTSGHRRVRADIEAAIAAVVPDANGARDIRHIVGGPTVWLPLDENGQTIGPQASRGTPAHLPLIGRPR